MTVSDILHEKTICDIVVKQREIIDDIIVVISITQFFFDRILLLGKGSSDGRVRNTRRRGLTEVPLGVHLNLMM